MWLTLNLQFCQSHHTDALYQRVLNVFHSVTKMILTHWEQQSLMWSSSGWTASPAAFEKALVYCDFQGTVCCPQHPESPVPGIWAKADSKAAPQLPGRSCHSWLQCSENSMLCLFCMHGEWRALSHFWNTLEYHSMWFSPESPNSVSGFQAVKWNYLLQPLSCFSLNYFIFI